MLDICTLLHTKVYLLYPVCRHSRFVIHGFELFLLLDVLTTLYSSDSPPQNFSCLLLFLSSLFPFLPSLSAATFSKINHRRLLMAADHATRPTAKEFSLSHSTKDAATAALAVASIQI